MGYLKQFARKKKETREKVITGRLSSDVYDQFKRYCNGLGLTMSEALALLVEREIHKDGKGIHDEDKRIRNEDKRIRNEDMPDKKVKTGGHKTKQSIRKRFTTKEFVVNGRLPCPICETWPERQANIARHMREVHNSTTQKVYTAHMDKVREMFKARAF